MYEFLEYTAADVMTYRPFTIRPDTPLGEANRIFERHDFNCLPVTHEGAVRGVLTKLDVLRAFAFRRDTMIPPYESILKHPVHTVMTREPVTVRPDTPLTRVLETMVQTRYRSVLVTRDAMLLGIVSREDVLRALRLAADGIRPGTRHACAEARA